MQVIVNRNDDEKEETHSICTYRIFFFNMKNSWFGKKKGYTNVIEAFPCTLTQYWYRFSLKHMLALKDFVNISL